jgi:hypothetical protein
VAALTFWIVAVPAHSFAEPVRSWVTAAARVIPGVCGVLVSSASPGMTRTPSVRQFDLVPGSIAPMQ